VKSEYPNAALTRDDADLKSWAHQVRELVAGEKISHEIPLDIRGTAFQQKVCSNLQKIPSGETRTYSEVAEAMGRRSAVRAVATACASNHLAVVVPCHRVVHKGGNANRLPLGHSSQTAASSERSCCPVLPSNLVIPKTTARTLLCVQ